MIGSSSLDFSCCLAVDTWSTKARGQTVTAVIALKEKLTRGKICLANFKTPLGMVQV